MSRYDAVFFDFDGVLADSEPIHYQCWREVLADYGVHLDWDTYARVCIGVADRPMVQALCRQIAPPADFDRVWQDYPRKNALFRERVAIQPPVSAATIEFVRSLSGYKMAVVSSSHRSEVEPMLIAAGIRVCFDAVVCGGDVARLKPAPEPYVKAAELTGARVALVVEDSESGIASGRAAGFDVVAVRSTAEVPELVRAALNGIRA